jgi:hypothetical protein
MQLRDRAGQPSGGGVAGPTRFSQLMDSDHTQEGQHRDIPEHHLHSPRRTQTQMDTKGGKIGGR